MNTKRGDQPVGFAAVSWERVPRVIRPSVPERHSPYGAPDLPYRKPASMKSLLEGRKVFRPRKHDYQNVSALHVVLAFAPKPLRERMHEEVEANQHILAQERAKARMVRRMPRPDSEI